MPTIEELQKSNNIVTLLEDEQLATIARQCVQGYELDEESRSEWKGRVDDAMKIALQVMEKKDTPWENASSIKFPLIAEAGINFAAQVLPEIIQNDKVVKLSVTGKDPKSDKYARAERVSRCMSYQLLVQSPDWVEGVDMALTMLPIIGTIFKKSYYNHQDGQLVDEVCAPDKIVVNYNTQSLEKARRITHVLTVYKNDILENQRRGLYDDRVELDSLQPDSEFAQDEDYPLNLLEQHCYLDLDEDGYKEPYIVIVHALSMQVLRIVNRFEEVEKKDGKVIRIIPCNYFTDYHFMRSPDGGFYSIGFGTLLLPINSAINTLINQLIDSGTLANMQGGFVGRGLRIRNGQFSFKMGEWKVLDASGGTDIRDNIFPMPTKEPSQVLFTLLGLLIQVGKDLISSTDVMTGKQPAQNVSSNTIAQLIEQGSRVFTAVTKRYYRSAQKSYRKLYYLNYKYLTQKAYQKILDDEQANVKQDFELESADVYPIADPNLSTDNQRLMRASVIQNLRTADPRAADTLLLEALHLDTDVIEKLLPQPDPNAPPSLEAQKMQIEIEKMKSDIAQSGADTQLAAQKAALETAQMQKAAQEADSRINEALARIWKMQKDALHNDNKLSIVNTKMQKQEAFKKEGLSHKIDKDQADLIVKVNTEANNQATEIMKIKAQLAEAAAEPKKIHSADEIVRTGRINGFPLKKNK